MGRRTRTQKNIGIRFSIPQPYLVKSNCILYSEALRLLQHWGWPGDKQLDFKPDYVM